MVNMEPYFGMSTARPDNVYAKGGLFDFSSPEGLFVFGAIALIILAVMGWAVVHYRGRNRRRRHHHRHHHHHHHHGDDHHPHDHHRENQQEVDEPETGGHTSSEEDDAEAGESETGHRVRRKRRRRRREHRPRNPTLAETGGLPPIRTEAPPGP